MISTGYAQKNSRSLVQDMACRAVHGSAMNKDLEAGMCVCLTQRNELTRLTALDALPTWNDLCTRPMRLAFYIQSG